MADDYAKMLHIGELECSEVISAALNVLLVSDKEEKMDFDFCGYLNISACPSSESGNVCCCHSPISICQYECVSSLVV